MEKIKQRDQMFQKREDFLLENIGKLKKDSDRLSMIRTLFFLTSAGFAAIAVWKQKNSLFFGIAAVFFFAFLAAVLIHTRKKNQQKNAESLLDIHREHKGRLSHQFSVLSDTGDDFNDSNHAFSGDLDLFGQSSLFHLLNAASTWHGRRKLANLLTVASQTSRQAKEDLQIENIRKRQESVHELSQNLDFIEDLQCAARLSRQKANDPRDFLAYAKGDTKDKTPIHKTDMIFSSILNFVFILSVILGAMGMMPTIPVYCILVIKAVVVAISYRRYQALFDAVESFYKEANSYTFLFRKIEESSFSTPLLAEIQKLFIGTDAENCASGRNKNLASIFRFIHLRSQPLISIILNLLFFLDKYCLWFLEKWKAENGRQLEQYLEKLGEIEALMSLSLIRHIYPDSVFPELLEEEKAGFWADDMGHPLISVDRQIRNDFTLESGTALITGSNMSGKTTLLRTVGINSVLAYAGTFCCARNLRLYVMRIGASMRIADNLGEGLSTFYAELLRVGNIIKQADVDEPLLFLIDEIFRGTNSRDRTDGAEMVLQKLTKSNIIGLMSTHDYELCTVSEKNGLPIINYHFSEYYDAEGLHFPYKLEPGVSTSANARYLMGLMGIS